MTFRTFGILGGYALLMLGLVLARPLLPIDETRYLAVAWEMRLSGDLFHLTRNFASYSHKPPLLFWIVNLVWGITGVSELAGRLVGPAFAVAAVAGTGALAHRLWPDDRALALRAMLVMATLPVFAVYGSATMFDALLTVIVLGLVAVVWTIGQGRFAGTDRGWWLLGCLLGLGVLAKGPVVLVHVVPVFAALPLWAAAPPAPREALRGAGIALLVGLGIVLLWLVPALVTGDAAFRHELLWTQTAGRVAGDLGHGRPVWFLLALLPVVLFPWGWSWRLWRQLPAAWRADPAARFCIVWAGAALALFSVIGGKQMHYLLPELPAFALLVARVLRPMDADRRGGSAAIVLPLALLAVAIAAFSGAVPGVPAAAAGLLALGAAGIAALLWRLPLRAGHMATGLALPVVLHLAIAFGGFGARFDTEDIAKAVAQAVPNGVAVFGMPYNADFNFRARLTVPVALPASEADLVAWAATHPEGAVFAPVRAVPTAPAPLTVWTYRDRLFGMWPASAFTARGSAPLG
jgi:4-amino-4-deoxy-L-arabinose transferase-like glycosyltransferase